MIHQFLMTVAALVRLIRGWVLAVFLVVILLATNVATLVSGRVHDTLHGLVWSAIDLATGAIDGQRPRNRAELQAEADRSRISATIANSERDVVKAESDRLHARLDALEAQNLTLHTELDASGRRIADLEADNFRAKGVAEGARVEAERARKALDLAQIETDKVQERLVAADARKLALEAEIRRLASLRSTDMSPEMREKAFATLEDLRLRTVRQIKRNASVEMFQAVPFVGTGLVLGALAYEIEDACNQYKDIEALGTLMRGEAPGESATDPLCLMSFEALVSAFTGNDGAFARCVADRIALSDLNPPSCAGFDPALPSVGSGPFGTDAPMPVLPVIR
jgi:hypothetical protein